MKKFVLLYICMLVVAPLFAQTNFQDLTLEKALEKAKSENKRVFVDCYTSWCGPCKMMADKILPMKEVGDYMNERFVCVKYDMEVGKGKEIAAKYHVTSYPTFLVLDGEGRLLLRVIGGTATGEEFVGKLKAGLDENGIENLEKRYNAGGRGVAFMLKYIRALKGCGDVAKAREVALELLTSLNDEERMSAPCWGIYDDVELSPEGSGNMIYLLKHVDQFRQSVGAEQVDNRIALLFEGQLEDVLRGKNKNVILADVENLETMLKSYRLTGKDYLFDYISLIKFIQTGDSENALAACRKVFTPMSDEKLSFLYFQPILALKGKWTKSQKKELKILTMELVERVENAVLKDSLKSFADMMISNL